MRRTSGKPLAYCEKCASRNAVDIFAELGRTFHAITTCVGRVGDDYTQSEADGVRSEARGRKRKRQYLTMDASEIHPSSDQLADRDISEALIHLSLDNWGSGKHPPI